MHICDDTRQDVVVPGSIARVPDIGAAECVTLEEVKGYLHVGYADEDVLIQKLIIAAREWVEEQTGRAIIKQAVTCRIELYHSMELPFGPIYPDTVVTPDPDTDCIVIGPGPFPRVQGAGIFDLQYTAGQDTDNVPEGIKLAIMARVAATHENRGDQDKSNYAQIALDHLAPYKRLFQWL